CPKDEKLLRFLGRKRAVTMQQIATGFGLVEAPLWDPRKGLYFSDVLNGGVYLLSRSDEVSQIVPKRRGVGGMALHAAGGLVMGGPNFPFFPPRVVPPNRGLRSATFLALPVSMTSPLTGQGEFTSARWRFACSAAMRRYLGCFTRSISMALCARFP